MAQLFDCSTDNISLHLKNIFASGELNAETVTEKSSATASDGKKYRMKFYNLDAIISVGYRINSIRASERKFYQKITDIYATAVDYSPTAATSKVFLLWCRTSCIMQFINIRLRK